MGWSAQYFTDIIIEGSSAGIFIYSPTVGAGNLIGSWTSTAGTDPFGNTYPQGINVEQGMISGTTSIFFYSPSTGAGNLYYSLTETSGTDSFGNAYLAGATFYGQPVSGTWIAVNSGISSSASGQQFYVASSFAGPWGIDSWVRRSGSNAGQLEIGPIVELLSTPLLPATPVSGGKLWTPNSTNTPRVMKLDGEPGYAIGEKVVVATNTQTLSTAFPTTIAGGGVSLTCAVASGVQYAFEAFFRMQHGATFVGGDTDLVGFSGPATSACTWFANFSASATPPASTTVGYQGVASLTSLAFSPGGASFFIYLHAWGTFTPSANGTFAAAAGQGTGSTQFSVLPGTYLKVRTCA